MNSWRKYYLSLILLIVGISLTGCGASGGGSSKNSSYDSNGYGNSSDLEISEEESGLADTDASGGQEKSEKNDSSEQSKANIDLEKIIYSGSVTVYTEDFQKTLSALDEMVKSNQGFVESSNFNDSNAAEGNSSDYTSHYSYEATIRIPSEQFQKVIDSVGELGKASNKTTQAENVTQEYRDSQAELEVYQAQRERYMEQLKSVKDDNVALSLQEKILQLDTQIAKIKSRLTNMDNQVNYSTIHVSVQEYTMYEEEQEKTFFKELKDVLKEAVENIGDMTLVIIRFVTIWLFRIIVYGILAIIIFKVIVYILKFFGILKSDNRFTLKNILKKRN